MREKYENGKLCGAIKENTVMQTYIANPYLLDGHKFDIRVFMLVASTNPLIVYYHDGSFRVAMQIFNPDSTDLNAHLTNLP